jgi:methylated-DNA-[protein]-cysteine S-methyltransferase
VRTSSVTRDDGGVAPGVDAPVTVTSRVATPIGVLTLAARSDGVLVGVGLPHLPPPPGPASDEVLAPVVAAFEAYFAGELRVWPLRVAAAGSAFQHLVWDALTRIPYAATCTYGQLAAAVGRPGAARAVGAANRVNPVPIVVPCHRVIGADGSLTGYAGRTGLDLKRQLLDLEAGVAPLAV